MKATFLKSISAIFLIYASFISDAQVSSPWVEKGPFGKIPYVNSSQVQGNGLVNCVETDPLDPNKLYIGTPGGIWRSTDGGQNWSIFAGNKEFNRTVSVGNIVVSQASSNVIFASTGVGISWGGCPTCVPDQNTSGVYRGVISGTTVTWQNISTGLPNMDAIYATTGEKGYKIQELKQCPFNPEILFAGTERGLYRCLNANSGSPTWQLININGVGVNSVLSIEYTKSSVLGNYVLYVTGNNFAFKTTDLVSWTNLVGTCTNCLSLTGSFLTKLNNAASVDSYEILVTPSKKHDNRMYVGLLTVGGGTVQRYLYSHDVNSWTKLSEPRSHWSAPRSGWRPRVTCLYKPSTSANEIIVLASEIIDGVIENGIPLNGTGTYTTFYNEIGYSTRTGSQDSHADINDLKVSIDNSYIYCANDGFLSKFNPFNSTLNAASSWMPMQNNGLSLGVSYFISVSPASSDFFGTGFMHNGNMFYKAGQGWKAIQEGDGLDQEFYGNDIYANNNGGVTFLFSSPNYLTQTYNANYRPDGSFYSLFGSGSGPWQYRKIYKDPADPSKTYITTYVGLYRISNGGIQNPTLLVDFTQSPYWIWNNFSALAISNINNNVMYAAFTEPHNVPWNGGPMIRYTYTGQTPLSPWQSLAIPADNAKDKIRSMAVSSANPHTLYVAFTKAFVPTATTNPRARVLVSKDGGALVDYNNSKNTIDPRYEVYCILFENGSNEGVYAGTDNGVYYTNKTMTSWIRYDVGLPNVPVTEMVYHPKDNVILASTWGRGVWQVYPYCIAASNVTINTSNFNAYKNTPTQVNGTITFSANISNQTPKSIYELRASNDISFLAGTSFTALNNTSRLLAYITPCGSSGSASNLRVAESTSDEEISTVETDFEQDQNKMKVYPNPVQNGKTTLNLADYYDKQLLIVVYDVNGMQIKLIKNNLTDKELEIDLSDQGPGIYMIKVTSDKQQVYMDKIVIIGTTGEDIDTNRKSNANPKK